MRRLLVNASVTLGLSACLSGTTFAQLKDNFELNVFGGGSWSSAKTYDFPYPQVMSVFPISGELRLNRAVRGGVRLGVYSHGHWGEEFFYSYEPNEVEFNASSSPSTTVRLTTQVHNYGANALYYFKEYENGVHPFLSIGIGGTVYRVSPQSTLFANNPLQGNLLTVHNSNELSMNYGIGLKTRATEWFGFRVDARGFITRTPNLGLPRSSTNPNVSVLPATGGIYTAEATAGLIFYFFGRR
jgi:opacity protein-like surface antigen